MPSETDIANYAVGKLGGAGEDLNGVAMIPSIDDPGKTASWLKLFLPRARRRVIIDLAFKESPFRSTIRFKDLGSEIDSDATPEIGEYQHAFPLPGDSLLVVRQFYESQIRTRARTGTTIVEVHWEEVANKDGTGKILLTDLLTNLDGTSAFIEYVIDIVDTKAFSEEMIECIATLLASLAAPVIGSDRETAVELLIEYKQVAVPAAQAANQKGFNDSTKAVPDFSGGRSTTGFLPAVNVGLGTYITATGDRREIHP